MELKIKPTQPVMPDYEDYIAEIRDIWDSHALTNNGPKVQKLAQMLKDYTGCKNADLFVNGHSALLIALKALRLEGEVITSPFTFVSTTNAIVQSGLAPVFGDIDDTYNLSVASIEKLVTPRTCAIVTPHIFGIPCDVMGIRQLAQKYNLKVVYDGAQAFGTKINGKSIACFGDAVMFSLHAIKVYNSIEGGLLAYQDDGLQELLAKYKNFGISYNPQGNDVEEAGYNAKMNEFQAAMGLLNLGGLEEEIEARKHLAQVYCTLLQGIDGISTYGYEDGIDYNYAYFPIKVTEDYGISRDELWTRLQERGIGTRKLYDKLTCDFSVYEHCGYRRDTTNADRVKKMALDLPIYGSLSERDVELVCKEIRDIRR